MGTDGRSVAWTAPLRARCVTLLVVAALVAPCRAAAQSAIETVVVTASALPGTEVDPDLVPTATQNLTAVDISRDGSASLLRSLGQSGGVSLSNAQDNPFEPNLYFRGFQASPLAGDAQGLAVYVDGVRFNQPFGDAVAWELIPDIAIESATVEGSNPVFGLNALGGSIALRMKDGFSWSGAEAEASGGSFDRYDAQFQFGRQDGAFSFYAAGNALRETGWRDHSPSRLGQLFANAGWRRGGLDLRLDLIGADTSLTGNGSAPVQLLAVDRAAVFTWPDTQENFYGLANLFGSYQASPALSFQGDIYASHLSQNTINGDASDLEPCAQMAGLLCLGTEIATGAGGDPIPDFLHGGTYAQLNAAATASAAFGASAQTLYKSALFGRDNQLLLGASYDAGRTGFSATSAVGAMTPDRGFKGPSVVIDMTDGSIAPVDVSSDNDYVGVYAADIFRPVEAASITASARYNFSRIALRDRIGRALDGSHDYGRINPAIGATYEVSEVATLYAGYAEANRSPTPAEFSCADPTAPCSLTNFFVADPDLKQVVSHTIEAGLRGRSHEISWRAGYFHVDADDDILFAASAITGRAFFENIGRTTRQGIEASADVHLGALRLSVNYVFTDAVFGDAITLNSEDNPRADQNGQIHVVPGDRLPGIPANTLAVSADYAVDPTWSLGLSSRYADGQFLRGDESNLNAKTRPYVVLDFYARCRVSDRLELFARLENLTDEKYETFGGFSPIDKVPIVEVPNASNPRSLSPAAPLSAYAGLRVRI